MSESLPAERVASGCPREGGPRAKAFSEVTGGRVPSFHGLSVGETPGPERSRGEQREGAELPHR